MVSQVQYAPGKERDIVRGLLTWGMMEKSCLLKACCTLELGLALMLRLLPLLLQGTSYPVTI